MLSSKLTILQSLKLLSVLTVMCAVCLWSQTGFGMACSDVIKKEQVIEYRSGEGVLVSLASGEQKLLIAGGITGHKELLNMVVEMNQLEVVKILWAGEYITNKAGQLLIASDKSGNYNKTLRQQSVAVAGKEVAFHFGEDSGKTHLLNFFKQSAPHLLAEKEFSFKYVEQGKSEASLIRDRNDVKNNSSLLRHEFGTIYGIVAGFTEVIGLYQEMGNLEKVREYIGDIFRNIPTARQIIYPPTETSFAYLFNQNEELDGKTVYLSTFVSHRQHQAVIRKHAAFLDQLMLMGLELSSEVGGTEANYNPEKAAEAFYNQYQADVSERSDDNRGFINTRDTLKYLEDSAREIVEIHSQAIEGIGYQIIE